MIQRVQTIYLVLAFLCVALLPPCFQNDEARSTFWTMFLRSQYLLMLSHISFCLFSLYMHYESTKHRADEWPLRKPLQQCSLRVERRGDILLVVFTYKKEGSPPALFAVCKIDLEENPMEHFVQAVGDSSRFFAVRVTDEKGGREAIIGLGFKEREE